MNRFLPSAVTSILHAGGRTPLVRLTAWERPGGPALYAKVEFLGPGGSIFDRAALAELDAAERAGHLDGGRPLVAAGGGDVVISLAMAASAAGNPLTVYAPRSLAQARRELLTAYGARVEWVDDATGHDVAQELAFAAAGAHHALYVDLFGGSTILRAYAAIGAELCEALAGPPTVTVCGLDLGTIPTGIARGLSGGRVVAVEPSAAPVASGGTFGAHLLGGLVPGPRLAALDRALVSEFDAVDEQDAWQMSGRLSRETGLLAGISSGAVLVAALRRAAHLGQGDSVVAVLPDHGSRRHLLSPFFEAA